MEVGIDWKNPLDRKGFEKSLRDHRARRLLWTSGQKTVWVAQIFLLQLVVIGALYGSVAYNLVNNELDLKAIEEEKCYCLGLICPSALLLLIVLKITGSSNTIMISILFKISSLQEKLFQR